MHAASHIDWYLIAINKLLAELQSECEEEDPRLKAIQDLRYATAFANEYMTVQAVYIHSGMINMMRTHYVEQMIGLEDEEKNELMLQPYNAKSAFNGHIANIIKTKQQRDQTDAIHRLATRERSPSPKEPKKSALLQKLQDIKQKRKVVSTKSKKKDKKNHRDSKPKKSFPKQRKDQPWKQPKHHNQDFPFNPTKFHKKKPKKSDNYKPKSGGRARDFHN